MKIVIASVLTLSLLTLPAQACRMTPDGLREPFEKADTVFIGRPVELVPATRATRQAIDQATTVTFDVERVIRGRPIDGVVKVYGYDGPWDISSFPESLEKLLKLGPTVAVAIIFPDTIKARTGCRYNDRDTGQSEGLAAVHCRIDLPVAIPFERDTPIPLAYPTITDTICLGAFVRPLRDGKLLPFELEPPLLATSP